MMGAFHTEPVKNQWNSRRTREKPQVDVGTENKGAYRKSELAGWLVFAKNEILEIGFL